MRNIFDQYNHPENKLTHALMSLLALDSPACKLFCRKVLGLRRVPRNLEVGEQAAGHGKGKWGVREGIPDGYIQSLDDGWIVLIEAKVSAGFGADQLGRHLRSLDREQFKTVHLVAITVDGKLSKAAPQGTLSLTWQQLYSHFKKNPGKMGHWLTGYMELLERRWTADDKEGRIYMKNGTLTRFAGFLFDGPDDYEYNEAKRSLKLWLQDIRKKGGPHWAKKHGADFSLKAGRGAITGRKESSVWDYIPVAEKGSAGHTGYPHMTFAINREQLVIMITFPYQLKPAFRRNFRQLGNDAFEKLIVGIVRKLEKIGRQHKGFRPYVEIVHRSYASQRAKPVVHSELKADLRVFFPGLGGAAKIKKGHLSFEQIREPIFTRPKGNVQVSMGVRAAIGSHGVKSAKLTQAALQVWETMMPVVSVCLGR